MKRDLRCSGVVGRDKSSGIWKYFEW